MMKRQLSLGGAAVLGISSMVGAGLFASFGPAAESAGSLLFAALLLAAAIAFFNATASAQLAAQYPTSGGTYVYGRERLGPWWGFAAGWSFLIGKTASVAAMALTFGHYAAPQHSTAAAVAVLLIVSAINHAGITRTARAAAFILLITLVSLAIVLGVGWSEQAPVTDSAASSPYGVLQGAGLLFFAFAGYARVATLGEEVKDPEKTIPRAILLALGCVLVLYAIVAFSLVTLIGYGGLASSTHPLADLSDSTAVQVVLTVGVSAACAGSILGLMAGISRTGLAMAREGDLPRGLSALHRNGVPHRIDLILLAVTTILVLFVPLEGAIGFSSFGVLLYYAIANLSAFTQSRRHRRYPRLYQVLGVIGCVAVAFSLPAQSVLSGTAVLIVGLILRIAGRVRP